MLKPSHGVPNRPHASVQRIEDEALRATLARKLAPPLVTLLGAEPELQYVALRNIALISEAHPAVLANDVKVGVGVGAHVCAYVCHPVCPTPPCICVFT